MICFVLIPKSPTLAAIKLTMLINICSSDVAAEDTKRILVSRLCKAGPGHFISAEKRSTPQIRIRAEKKVLLRNIKVSFNTLKYEMRQLYYKLRLKLFKFNFKTRFDVLKLLKVAPGA